MFKRIRAAVAALGAGAAALPSPAPAPDPVTLLHDDLRQLGFAEQVSEGRRGFTREVPGRLAIVTSADGQHLPTPQDWSVGVYDTTSALWPAEPTRCVLLYARCDLPPDLNLAVIAAVAHLPKGI